jgi:hypothetical protein
MNLTQDLLKEYLEYNPDLGTFKWLKKPNRNIVLGSTAGGYDVNGYLKISLLGKSMYAHRLAFLYMLGEMPAEVDHIDLNKSNCKWENLRPCTRSQNRNNRGLSARNTSGVKGVRWCPRAKKWKVTIFTDKVQKHLGYFLDLEEAKAKIYTIREQLHGEFTNHG